MDAPRKKSSSPELPVKTFKSPESWQQWLESNHIQSPGIWLKIAKKDSGQASVTYSEALSGALCYGWIDGQKRPLDEQYWLQKFCPRRPKSIWSKTNCSHAEELIRVGKMKPAGLLEVERARSDGRWASAYASQSKAEVPADLQKALDARPAAAAFFSTLNKVNRYAILFRIHQAKKPETRAARIEKFVAMLEENRKIHP